MSAALRSSYSVAFTTWKALFLRTAVQRLSASRFAWFWLVFEPLASIVVLMLIFTFLRVRHIGGISTPVWVMAGVLTFNAFSGVVEQAQRALRPNRGLFAFPQVTPFDPILIYAALEGFILLLVSILLLAGAELIGYDVMPLDPLAVMEAVVGMWLLGFGYGLILSTALVAAPPAASVLRVILRPMRILSGVILPVILIVPYPYREWLLWNPLLHGIEIARKGFAPYYRLDPAISLGYLYGWALALLFLGLALHTHFADRLAVRK